METKKISRQRQWQLDHRALGKCESCSRKAAIGYRKCKKHVLADRKHYIKKRKYRIPF